MRSDLFASENLERESATPGMQLQNSKLLKVRLNGNMLARKGSMVAYQGQMQFEYKGAGGVGKWLKQAATGEGVPLMSVTGQGDLFLAQDAADIYIIDLEGGNDGLSINGANVLAFEPSLNYDVKMIGNAGILAGGLFNCVFHGQGRIAIMTKGTPVIMNVNQPTFADPQAAIAWSSTLSVGLHKAESFGLKSLIGKNTGERYSLSFNGQGFVVVQPSEIPPGGLIAGSGSGSTSGGGVLGGILGG